ncbi:hypothetical protein VKT23_009543 [Stygiomarasmius scandens]|uniref:Uncharacterized protein n=1 Tax=Marasmiellus scandens TaxID=2682957 RepID=A0ABR1JIQ8_9AGAR
MPSPDTICFTEAADHPRSEELDVLQKSDIPSLQVSNNTVDQPSSAKGYNHNARLSASSSPSSFNTEMGQGPTDSVVEMKMPQPTLIVTEEESQRIEIQAPSNSTDPPVLPSPPVEAAKVKNRWYTPIVKAVKSRFGFGRS